MKQNTFAVAYLPMKCNDSSIISFILNNISYCDSLFNRKPFRNIWACHDNAWSKFILIFSIKIKTAMDIFSTSKIKFLSILYHSFFRWGFRYIHHIFHRLQFNIMTWEYNVNQNKRDLMNNGPIYVLCDRVIYYAIFKLFHSYKRVSSFRYTVV